MVYKSLNSPVEILWMLNYVFYRDKECFKITEIVVYNIMQLRGDNFRIEVCEAIAGSSHAGKFVVGKFFFHNAVLAKFFRNFTICGCAPAFYTGEDMRANVEDTFQCFPQAQFRNIIMIIGRIIKFLLWHLH